MKNNRQCLTVKDLPGYEKAKLWWRSRTPQERNSGISYNLDTISPIRSITVPVPFQGVVVVSVSSMTSHKQSVVKVSKRQLNSLRDLFSLPGHKGWRVLQGKNRVVFIRGGEIHVWRDLWGGEVS